MSSSRPQVLVHDWNQWHLGVLPLLMMFAALMLYMFAAQRVGTWSPSEPFLPGGPDRHVPATQSIIGVFDMELLQ